MAKLIGTDPNQVPTNADLGTMAYQDATDVKVQNLDIKDGTRTVLTTTITDHSATLKLGQRPNQDGYSTLSFDAGQASGVIKLEADSNHGLALYTSSVIQVRVRDNGLLDVKTGLLELDGNDIGGTQVTIADDAVASITPPRKGGFMMITANGASDYPTGSTWSANSVYYDVGASLAIQLRDTYATNVEVTTSDVTGTTGTDSKVTVAAQTGVIKIENRSGGSITFQITFL